jgi:hypothetical protein
VALLARLAERNERRARGFPRAEEDAHATVCVQPDVMTAIATAAAGAGDDETGGPLFGTVQRSWDGAAFELRVSILGTVPPGPSVRGRPCWVALGADGDGERAASALRWLRAVTGLDLLHVGDWHKHPSGESEPSTGDLLTARAMRVDAAAPLWLLAVVVGDETARERVCEGHRVVGYARDLSGWAELRLYQAAGSSPLTPVRVRPEDDAIPRLPDLPWHITDPARFAAECRLLAAAGFRVAVEGATPGGTPELVLRVSRDSAPPLRVATGPRYPDEAPALLDGRGKRLAVRRWARDRFLVDAVREQRR